MSTHATQPVPVRSEPTPADRARAELAEQGITQFSITDAEALRFVADLIETAVAS